MMMAPPALLVLLFCLRAPTIASFVPRKRPSFIGTGFKFTKRRKTTECCDSSALSNSASDASSSSAPPIQHHHEDDNDSLRNDAALLKQVTKKQLVQLCQQCQISSKGTKQVLLKRLRDHAEAQAEAARQRNLKRLERVQGSSSSSSSSTDQTATTTQYSSKERYEIVSDDPVEEEEEAFFYFQAPTSPAENQTTTTTDDKKKKKPAARAATVLDQSTVTAPPPPTQVNADGELVRTIYSTTDHNDLTGIAAAQPGQAASAAAAESLADAAINTGYSSAAPQPWDTAGKSSAARSEATSAELDRAKETVAELVSTLVAMTGAPGFATGYDDDDDDDDDDHDVVDHDELLESQTDVNDFVGFQPANVPTDLLTASSKALRAGRGQVLQEVLRQVELQAIGHDGMRGDDKTRGGGHYREVSKVRAFLEGYRVAEVRRLARETTALLLDKLILEGVEGLDLTLNSMVRSSDDANSGELNDSLIEFLNDAIRQQERKVDQLVAARLDASSDTVDDDKDGLDNHDDDGDEDDDDVLEQLWNVTNENGERVETLDPNDPKVKMALENEIAKRAASASSSVTETNTVRIPETAPEQLLLLLTLLRERIKTEAAFAPDEKGRNLRLLAYCLRLSSDSEREQLILKDLGNSLDRLDSFSELVSSSIEYGESTSYELQPAKKRVLNLPQLKSILELTERLREKQTWKASGLAS